MSIMLLSWRCKDRGARGRVQLYGGGSDGGRGGPDGASGGGGDHRHSLFYLLV